MAVLNKVILDGRFTRDVETRAFQNGGMVANFGFAVSNRKKNGSTGEWEDDPMFIDCAAYNRGEFGKLADLVRDRCQKGTRAIIEARLELEQWEDKNGGGRRSKHKLTVDNITLVDRFKDREGGTAPEGEAGDKPAETKAAPPKKGADAPKKAAGGPKASGRTKSPDPGPGFDGGDDAPDSSIPF